MILKAGLILKVDQLNENQIRLINWYDSHITFIVRQIDL